MDGPDGFTKYGVRGRPTTVFIDAEGNIIDQHVGTMDQSSLEAKINQLI